MVWNIITSISTSLAVVIALFLPAYQSRRRLVVEAVTPGRFTERKEVVIVVVNAGGRFMTVRRLLIQDANNHIREMRLDTPLPVTLRPSEAVHLSHPYVSEHLDALRAVFVEDSRGRRWKCHPRSISKTSWLLKHFIGKRFIYPSMGDKEFEDELR